MKRPISAKIAVTAIKDSLATLRKQGISKISLDQLNSILDSLLLDLDKATPKTVAEKQSVTVAGYIITAMCLGTAFGATIAALVYELML